MTYEQLYQTKPGRDLDGMVAELVLGYTRRTAPPDGEGKNGGNEFLVPPGYDRLCSEGWDLPKKGPIPFAFMARRMSTDLRDAMELWGELASRGWQCSLVHKPFEEHPEDSWVFHGVRLEGRGKKQRIGSFSAHAETKEHAIARGALASTMARTEQTA